MKKIILLLSCTCLLTIAHAQRVMTEGTILYNLSVVSGDKEPGMSDVFDGATLNLYFKGNLVLSEMRSFLLNQTTIYDGKNASAVILKTSGDQKYMIHLTPENWINYNRKYEGLTFTFTDETKTIAGYPVKKAVGKLQSKDGSSNEFTIWYTTALVPYIKGYDNQFIGLPGLPLEYEVENGKIKVKYTAAKIAFTPVPAFKFDIPQTGYRILDYTNH